MMRIISIVFLASIIVLSLSGCSSRHVYKDASYKDQLDQVSIDIAYVIFSPDRNKGLYIMANRNAAFMLKQIPSMLKQSLEQRGIQVLRGNLKVPSTSKVIRIEASDMNRSCTYGTNTYNYGRVISCDDEVWYKVSLSDSSVGKLVWSVEFKIDGRVYGYKQDRRLKLTHQFVQRIIKSLEKTGLIPER